MKSTLPAIDTNIVGDIPDAHAKRVVGEMVEFLSSVSTLYRDRLVNAMRQPIGGNPKSQQRWADRVNKSTLPILADFATAWGKRAKFAVVISVWNPDEWGGATVWNYMTVSEGPGKEKRTKGPLWRFSQHALVRLVQRTGATDAAKLMLAMRKVSEVVGDGMAAVGLTQGDRQILHLKFDGGHAVVEWPADFGIGGGEDGSRSRYGGPFADAALALVALDGGPVPSSLSLLQGRFFTVTFYAPAAHEKRPHQHYPTPPDLAQALPLGLSLAGLDLPRPLYDPCHGEGALLDALGGFGFGSDLHPEAYARRTRVWAAPIDASDPEALELALGSARSVVSNPPYGRDAEPIVRASVKLVEAGRIELAAFLVPLPWEAAGGRAELMSAVRFALSAAGVRCGSPGPTAAARCVRLAGVDGPRALAAQHLLAETKTVNFPLWVWLALAAIMLVIAVHHGMNQ